MIAPEGVLAAVPGGHVFTFAAMGSPCEVRVETEDGAEAKAIADGVMAEARRIEAKYSRYRPDSVLSRLNAAAGEATPLDDETAALVAFADQAHRLSGGLFDITSGVLRRAWRFDGSDGVPAAEAVAGLMPLVGWPRIDWRPPVLRMSPGMELDLGGLAKEYAVDCALLKATALSAAPLLVNFGGDLRVSGLRHGGAAWRVAIESVEPNSRSEGTIELLAGAVTTSGDARRFVLHDGRRYGHILDPRSGWPVEGAPRAVTVAAPTCIGAGFLSTLAMLHGAGAETFLAREGLTAWWLR